MYVHIHGPLHTCGGQDLLSLYYVDLWDGKCLYLQKVSYWPNIFLKSLLFTFLMHVCTHLPVCVRSEDNLESVLSFHHMVLGIKFRLSDLVARAYIGWAISLAHNMTLKTTKTKNKNRMHVCNSNTREAEMFGLHCKKPLLECLPTFY